MRRFGSYLQKLEPIVANAPCDQTIVQIELLPSRAPSILLTTRPPIDTIRLHKELLSVPACKVKGRTAAQIQARPEK